MEKKRKENKVVSIHFAWIKYGRKKKEILNFIWIDEEKEKKGKDQVLI